MSNDTIIYPPPVGDDPLFTTKQAARYLSLSPRTLERMRVEGTGPRFHRAGKGKRSRVLYRKSDLDRWLTAHQSTSEY